MQYSFAKACLLALATTTSVLAQIPGFNVLTAPTSHEVLKAGSKFTIKWTPSGPAAPISLKLMQGKDAQHLDLASGFIAESVDSAAGQFDWTVPADATLAAYGIKLELVSNPEQFQYSNPFTISGGVASGAGSSASTGEGEATISISASEPTKTADDSEKSTTTIKVSQISTAPTTSATKALSTSTSTKPEPTTTSTSTSTSEKPSSTAESTTAAPSTTEEPSTTLETSIAPPTSTQAPTTPASATPTGAAPRNAVVGSGILGAMVMVFALF